MVETCSIPPASLAPPGAHRRFFFFLALGAPCLVDDLFVEPCLPGGVFVENGAGRVEGLFFLKSGHARDFSRDFLSLLRFVAFVSSCEGSRNFIANDFSSSPKICSLGAFLDVSPSPPVIPFFRLFLRTVTSGDYWLSKCVNDGAPPFSRPDPDVFPPGS